jgi:hypothetical protein
VAGVSEEVVAGADEALRALEDLGAIGERGG